MSLLQTVGTHLFSCRAPQHSFLRFSSLHTNMGFLRSSIEGNPVPCGWYFVLLGHNASASWPLMLSFLFPLSCSYTGFIFALRVSSSACSGSFFSCTALPVSSDLLLAFAVFAYILRAPYLSCTVYLHIFLQVCGLGIGGWMAIRRYLMPLVLLARRHPCGYAN